jgi:ABC-type transport system substrate-binding protein
VAHHVDSFEFDLSASSGDEILDRVEAGTSDYAIIGGGPPAYFDPARRVVAKYGINKSRFFVKPGLALRTLAFNLSSPLFRDNLKLRRAINFAVDRRAFRRVVGGPLATYITDQYLPPSMPGFTNVAIYPQQPDLRRARVLARGNTRTGKVALYTIDNPVLDRTCPDPQEEPRAHRTGRSDLGVSASRAREPPGESG